MSLSFASWFRPPEEGTDGSLFSRTVAALKGQFPRADVNGAAYWGGMLTLAGKRPRGPSFRS